MQSAGGVLLLLLLLLLMWCGHDDDDNVYYRRYAYPNDRSNCRVAGSTRCGRHSSRLICQVNCGNRDRDVNLYRAVNYVCFVAGYSEYAC